MGRWRSWRRYSSIPGVCVELADRFVQTLGGKNVGGARQVVEEGCRLCKKHWQIIFDAWWCNAVANILVDGRVFALRLETVRTSRLRKPERASFAMGIHRRGEVLCFQFGRWSVGFPASNAPEVFLPHYQTDQFDRVGLTPWGICRVSSLEPRIHHARIRFPRVCSRRLSVAGASCPYPRIGRFQ